MRLFANLADDYGDDGLEVRLPDGTDVNGLLERLSTDHAKLRRPLADGAPGIRVAVNLEFAPRDRPLREGDEVGLIPPVGGG